MTKALTFFLLFSWAIFAVRNQGIAAEGEKRIFQATAAKMLIRSEPSTKATKERTLAQGALILGVLVGGEEKIQGKTGRWLAVGGITTDYYIFSGFLTDVTAEYEYKRDSCAVRGKNLECEGNKMPVDANVKIHVRKEVCGKRLGQVVLDIAMDETGSSKLSKALAKINDEIDIYIRKKDGVAVQVDYYGAPLECT